MKDQPKKQLVKNLLVLLSILLCCSVIVTILSGVFIGLYYIPYPTAAAQSLTFISENVFAGALFIASHKVSALVTITLIIGLIIVLLYIHPVTKPWLDLWRSSFILLILMGGLIGTGFFLRGDSSALALLQSWMHSLGQSGQANQLPSLYDQAPVLLSRLYLIHGFLLTGSVLGLVFYNRRKALELAVELKPWLLAKIVIFAFFTGFIMLIAIFYPHHESYIPDYTEHFLTKAPLFIRFLHFIGGQIPFFLLLFLSLLIVIFLWFFGNIMRKLRK